MRGLLDVLQGASNAAASNMSGPVDGLAWLLRKAGVPVDEPVGGSEWMAKRGLTAQPKSANMGLLGEALGMSAQIAAAAKAPQIARGLLKVGENAAIPRAMNPQAGAIVYHGSPHKFDKFDSSKIGTGEGAQAYGHGLYFADSPEVAKQYASKSAVTVGGKPFVSTDPEVARTMRIIARDPADAKKFFDQNIAGSADVDQINTWRAAFELAGKEKLGIVRDSSLYKVDLPDEQIAKMLDYDKAVPEAQRQQVSQAAMQQFGSGVSGSSGKQLYDQVVWEFKNAGSKNPQDDAVKFLRQQGVPGIRYLDGGSRGAGSGTSNYVVFPGEEGFLKILGRE
jgi:hypothetical protein